MEKLTPSELRSRLVANSFRSFRSLQDAFDGLKFVQADPIRRPARAQDLILRHRVVDYRAGDLEREYPSLEVEEGFLFAYGFMLPDTWQKIRWKPHEALSSKERAVLDAVHKLKEARSKDLDTLFGKNSVVNAWGGQSKETKGILEELHHRGYLKVGRRENGVRVYAVAGPMRKPSKRVCEELFADLLVTTVEVFGPVSQRFLFSELKLQNHLLPSRKDREIMVGKLVEYGRLQQVQVGCTVYLWVRDSWPEGNCEKVVRVLAPFDPLVRDRERFEQLWDWSYRFEAYVPAAKRLRGYYAMPVLWKDMVVGWANVQVQNNRLKVDFGYVNDTPKESEFIPAAKKEIADLCRFLGLAVGSADVSI